MKRTHAAFAFALSVACCIAGGCRKEQAVIPERVLKVATAEPESRRFRHKIRVQANVQTTQKAEISARVDGNLDLLNTDTGLSVKKGDMIFQVDHENLKNDVAVQDAKVAVTKAEKRTAEINLDLSRSVAAKALVDLKRAESLFASRAVSKDALEKQELNYSEALAGVDRAAAQLNYYESRLKQEEASLLISKKKLADSTAYAPFDGVVVGKLKELGEYVQVGTGIFQIENLHELEFSALIGAGYYDKIHPGKTGMVLYSPDGRKLAEGVITYRGPNIDSTSRTFEIKAKLPEIPDLVSGTLCDVDLILDERDGKGVPNEALLTRRDGSKMLFVVDDGKAEGIAVQPGIVDGNVTELLNASDLKGRKVVVEGQTFLAPGNRVEEVAVRTPPKKR